MRIWVQSTGHAFKLHRMLASIARHKFDVNVLITACGYPKKDNQLVDVCNGYGITPILDPWQPIMDSVKHIAKFESEPFIMCHDDVVFPFYAERYLNELMYPLEKRGDILMCGGKIWDAFYQDRNAYTNEEDMPGKEPFPNKMMAVSCVHSACFAVHPYAFRKVNPKADFDFERVIAMSIYEQDGGVVYYPTTDILWHEKAGTVDHYQNLPSVMNYIHLITVKTEHGTNFDTMWINAYGETPRESLDWLSRKAAEFARYSSLECVAVPGKCELFPHHKEANPFLSSANAS